MLQNETHQGGQDEIQLQTILGRMGGLVEAAASEMCTEGCEGFQKAGREGGGRREPIRFLEFN